MNILVAGGTGFLGAEIVSALLAAGHNVTILSRSEPKRGEQRSQWVRGDVTQPETLLAAVKGQDAIVDAVQFPNSPVENPKKGFTFERIDLGGTKNLANAAMTAGVSRFIGLSGSGAAENARFHWLRYKWQEEQHITALGLNYTIFRPTWIFGPNDVSLNRFLKLGSFLPFIPVIGNGKTRINVLSVRDLAAHVAAAIENEAAGRRIFEIGGPQVLTMDEVVRTALRVSGKRRFLLHQPAPMMKAIARLVQQLPGRPLTPDAIDFITMEAVADNSELLRTFGLPLTPLEDGLRTYLG